jgi:3D (Asp-Asp-Asp) domain-containing protein
MRKLILAGILGLLAQVHAANILIEPDPVKKPAKKIKVRVTAYWPGQDYWTSRYKSSTGYTLKSGKSCAVDPKLIPYGSTVVVAGREFRAIDTGSAVISRKASRGKYPVVDLFFASETKAMRELATLPKYAWVEVKPK